MKELILKDVIKINNQYISFITFSEYLSLIKNKIIDLPVIEGGNAFFYNNNKDISTVNGFEIILHANTENSNTEFYNGNLIISSELFQLIDGLNRTYTILDLNKRFMNSVLKLTVLVSDIYEAQEMIAERNKCKPIIPRKIKNMTISKEYNVVNCDEIKE